MRVFVTGGSGYVGRYVVDRLLGQGFEVTVLTRRVGWEAPGARAVIGDLVDFDSSVLAGHDACLHCGIVWGEPGSEWELPDVRAAVSLFEAAGVNGLKSIVYVSSTAVHRPFCGVMDERSALAPIDAYAATKVSNEAWLSAITQRFGMHGSVVRLGPVVGPAVDGGQMKVDRRFAAMIEAALCGDDICVKANDGRQFISASQAADAIVSAIGHDGVYLAVARELMTWERIAQRVIERTKSSSRIVVEEADAAGDARFNVDKLKRDLRLIFDAESAVVETIDHLIARTVRKG